MRKLTVSSLRRQWGHMYRTRYDIVPAIRLNGQWLARAGFEPGQQVSVMVGPDRTLSITPAEARQQ